MEIRHIARVKDVDVRKNEILLRAAEAQKAGKTRREYKFRSGAEALPIITLPMDYLIYRLENYRTRDRQLSLMASGALPHGFFDAGRREDASVQQKQHEILVSESQRGSGETIKAIYDELGKVGEQTDDLIISADGVVVNGNRRLSAMRELLAENSTRYGKFKDIICAVLPESSTADEILKLEIGLQMQPETKLPYEWTALGRAARDLLEVGMSDQMIADLMNRDKGDILRAIKMIDSADMYLSDWLKTPDEYDKLDETEQAFRQVATRNWEKKDDPALREITRKVDFFVIERRGDIEERAYKLINSIEDNPTLFLDTLAAELDIELSAAPPAIGTQHKISFDDESDTSFVRKDYGPIIERILAARGDGASEKSTIKVIEEVCQVVAEQGKNRDKAALKFAKNAERALLSIDIQSANTGTYPEIQTILTKCIDIANRIGDEISVRARN